MPVLCFGMHVSVLVRTLPECMQILKNRNLESLITVAYLDDGIDVLKQ